MSTKERKIAVDIIPFEINNLGSFLGDSTYPSYHPFSDEYDRYWDKKTEECLYGLWGDDSRKESEFSLKPKIGGYRWLPGNITFHIHHCVIELEIEGQDAKGLGKPMLRDVDWFIGYDLATCDGFAGYEDDKVFTAFRPIEKLEKGLLLTNAEKYYIEQHAEHLLDKHGRYKKYMDARTMLYNTYDEPLGKPLWLNEKLNYMLLSTRRLGKSYIIINGVVAYEFVFNGARTLDQFFNQSTKSTSVVGSGNSDKTKEFFDKWQKTYDHLRLNVGAYDDGITKESGAFWWKTRGTVVSENNFISNSVKEEGQVGFIGPGSNIWHVTYGLSSSKGAGTSMNNAIIEEVGLTPNPETIHAENSPAQESDKKFGKSIYIGTGGDFEKIEGSRKMFYNPGAYSLLACQNMFAPGSDDTARFIPAYYYKNIFRNENGMQDTQKALDDLMHDRNLKEKQDTKQFLHHQASYPTNPDEIFVKYDGNNFPVNNLQARRDALKNGALPYSIGKIAYHDIRNTNAYWIEDWDAKPLMDLDDLLDKKKGDIIINPNKQGAIVQYEAPNHDRPKRKYNDRNPMYMVFMEPVRNDRGSSYMYCYVWKFDDFANPRRMQHNIVMEWFGRYDNSNTKNLRVALDMAAYYDCNIFSEINNDGIKQAARDMMRYEWLQPSLGHIPGLEGNAVIDHDVGFYVGPKMNAGLEVLTNEMLRETVEVTDRIRGNQYIKEEIIMADTLNSRMLCSQLIAYNREGNFDAYDGLRLLAVWYKANKKPEKQYGNETETKKLLEVMRGMHKRQSASRKMVSLSNNYKN